MAKIDDKVAYLDDERKKLWAKLLAIEKKQFLVDNDLQFIEAEVKNKTSDYEDAAKQSSKKASEFRNKSEEAKNTTIQYLEEAKLKTQEIFGIHTAAEDLLNKTTELHNSSSINNDEIERIHSEISEQNDSISQNVI